MSRRARQLVTTLTVLVAMCWLSVPAARGSSGPWYHDFSAQGLLGNYVGAEDRERWNSARMAWRGDYLEQSSITLGYEYTFVELTPESIAGPGMNVRQRKRHLKQDMVNGGLVFHTYPDWAAGKLSLRGDGYFLRVEDETGDSGNAAALFAQMSLLSHSRRWYIDLGYAYSEYEDAIAVGTVLSVHQLTPTLGLGFGAQAATWLQARAYLVSASAIVAAADATEAAAVELKLTHYSGGERLLGVTRWYAGALLGSRFLALDPDVRTVYSLSDEQRTSGFVGAEWQLAEQGYLMAFLGTESYRDNAIDDDYRGDFAALTLGVHW